MSVFKIQNSSVDPGIYNAKFLGVEQTDHPEYGPGLKWIFEIIDDGDCEGKLVYRTTKTTPTPKNSLGKFLASLANQRVTDGLEVDPDIYVGKPYQVVVQESQGGTSRVESFTQSKIPF